MMKYILGLLFLTVSVIANVEYFGFTPSEDIHALLQGHATVMDRIGTERITHIISSGNRTGQDLDHFYANTLINNVTLHDILNPPVDQSTLEERTLEKRKMTVACSKSQVIDKLGDETVENICSAMASVSGSIVGGVVIIVNGKGCSASTDGQPTFCQVVVGATGVGLGGLTFDRLKYYCPKIMGQFMKCEGTSASGNADGAVAMTKQVTQVSKGCGSYNNPCSTITQTDNR